MAVLALAFNLPSHPRNTPQSPISEIRLTTKWNFFGEDFSGEEAVVVIDRYWGDSAVYREPAP